MGIVDGGHAQSDDVIRCPETFADHEYMTSRYFRNLAMIFGSDSS
jgi:hypothetical protein